MHYIFTRIQIEMDRRKSAERQRQPSLIFKPIPMFIPPSGKLCDILSDDSFSDFDFSSEEDDDGFESLQNQPYIDDDTLEDVYFEMAATLPYPTDTTVKNENKENSFVNKSTQEVCALFHAKYIYVCFCSFFSFFSHLVNLMKQIQLRC